MGKFRIYTQILQGNVLFSGKIYSWKYFYTTAGRDGRDKFQVCEYDMLTMCNSTSVCFVS